MRFPHLLVVLCTVAAPALSSWGADDPTPAPAPAPVTAPAPTAKPDAKPDAASAAKPDAKPAAKPAAKPDAAGDAAKTPGKKVQLNYLSGTVTIGANLASIDLPQDYKFLAAKDARFVVEKLWGNPPDESVLGLVVPPHQEDNFDWAIVVSYEESGYIKDDDAKTNDYTKILTDMQSQTREANPQRKKAGYPGVDLLGWAESPKYDGTTHKIYWAKRLQFEGSKVVTLNYDIRVLGRKGVLVLSAIASDSQLTEVAENSKAVLAKTSFTSGNRYEDFSASSGDKVAEYGIAGLITGAVLLKTGLLKLLIKPLIIGGLLVAGVVKSFLGRRKSPTLPPQSPQT